MPYPRSHIAGNVWPAVADTAAANLLALQWQFEHSERAPPEEIGAQQLQQLDALLAHAAAHVPFWRTRLAEVGLPGERLTWEDWRRLPVLSRAEVMAVGSALHAAPMPAQHGRLSQTATSGSTGQPLICVRTELAMFYWQAFVLREMLWHGWSPMGRLAAIRDDDAVRAPPPDGLTLADWGVPPRHVFATGPAALLDIRSPIAVQVDWLRRQDPDILLTWPSNLAALAQHCLAHGVRLPRLGVVRTLAETVTPALRALCREAWGARLVDAYSAEETGYLALQCPSGTHYHVQSEGVLLEVLDDSGAPCGPGETGRVVVTPLHNFAMPLLRYEIGDDAEVGPPCACGRTLPTLTRIVGRTRDRLMLPDGRRLFAYNPSDVFASVRTIRRYQIAQVAIDRLEIRLVADAPLTPAEEAMLQAAVLKWLGHPFAVRFVYHDALPHRPRTKFRDVVCEIGVQDRPDLTADDPRGS